MATECCNSGSFWGTAALCANVAIVYWKEFAINERNFSDGEAGFSIAIGALIALPLVYGAGRLIDRIGRRSGSVALFGLAALGVLTAYTLHGRWLLTGALCLAIFGISAIPVVLNSLTTELFPTHLRGDAFGWCNNVLGRIGYLVAPTLVGLAADAFGNKGLIIASTAVFPIVAAILVVTLLPETVGRELEQTSQIHDATG